MALAAEDVEAPVGITRVLTLCDEEGRNALTPSLICDLEDELDRAERDDAVGAVILTHLGKVFSAGTDLHHLSSVAGQPSQARAFLTDLVGVIRRVEVLPKLTIAAVEGAAVGGGFELALACDVRVMAADAWVRLPEVTLGALPGGGGVQRLTRFLGRARSLQAVLLAERIAAPACAALGLAILADGGKALDTALQLAATASAHGHVAMAAAKRLVHLAEDLPLEELDAAAVEAMVDALGSPEGVEGLAALLAHRTPDFGAARTRGRRA